MSDNPAKVARARAEQIIPLAMRGPEWGERWDAAEKACDEPVPLYAPGDVRPDGSIERAQLYGPGFYFPPITVGTVWVTPDQAARAAAFGWEETGGQSASGLVMVTR